MATIIRTVTPTDADAVRKFTKNLYQNNPPYLLKKAEYFLEKCLALYEGMVAEKEGEIVGTGFYTLLARDPTVHMKLWTTINYAHQARKKPSLVENIQKYFEEIKTDENRNQQVFAQFYDNDFTRQELLPDIKDAYFSSLGVLPEARREHIATRLIEERIRRAKENGAEVGYTSCWIEGHSQSIYEKMLFSPIAKLGIGIEGTVEMGKIL